MKSITVAPIIANINTDGYWTVKYGTKSRTLDKAVSGKLTSQFNK